MSCWRQAHRTHPILPLVPRSRRRLPAPGHRLADHPHVRIEQRAVEGKADAARQMTSSPAIGRIAPPLLDEYETYLIGRWKNGCTNACELRGKIVPPGCGSSYQRVVHGLH